MRVSILVLSAVLPVAVLADDITTRDGTVYKNAKVLRQDAATIEIMHSGGVSRIHKGNLPDDLQQNYGYNPAAAQEQMANEAKARQDAAARAAVDAAAKKDREEKFAKSKLSSGSVLNVIADGLLISSPENIGGEVILLVGHPDQKIVTDGKLVLFRAYPSGRYEYTNVMGGKRTIERWMWLGHAERRSKSWNGQTWTWLADPETK